MSQEVDELFGRGGGTAAPRSALAVGLLAAGVLMSGLGLFCTTVPGGIVVLAGWLVVEQDRDRLASGFLPSDSERTVKTLRSLSFAALLLVIVFVAIQFALLISTSTYPLMWSSWLQLIEAVRTPPPVPPAPVP